MKLRKFHFLIFVCLFTSKIFAQMGINATNTAPSPNAMLDISSTTKGLLIPRMNTANRTNLTATATDGLTVYDTDTKGYWFYNGSVWQNLSTVAGNTPWLTSGTNIYNGNTSNVGIGTNAPTYKLDLLHSGSNGMRIKSEVNFSILDIDAANGDAGIRFAVNGSNSWLVRNTPGSSNFQIFNMNGTPSEKFSIAKTTGTVRIEGPLASGTGYDAISFGGFGSLSVDAPGTAGGRFKIFENGNISIGNSTPDAKLAIAGNIKINDGTQATGKVLTSVDGSGIANWQTLPVATNLWTAIGTNIYANNTGNVGIGTSTPISFSNTSKTLSIHQSGNGYDLGPNLVLSYDTQGTNYGQIGTITFAQSNATSADKRIALITTNLDTNGGFGSLGNPKGHMDFYTNNGTAMQMGMMISSKGNVGLGGFGQPPVFPLTFPNALGDKISLFGNTLNAPHYGFGIQSGLLQIHTDAQTADVAFGSGQSSSFTERARIINAGEYGMTLTGRLQLRTGTQSAGHWLTNTANTVNAAFIGMAADDKVGFFGGTGAQWGFAMNTTNGNVGIGTTNPLSPLSFNNPFQKIAISLFKGGLGDVGLGVWANELRLQCDSPTGKVSFGDLDANGIYFELAKASNENQKFTVNGYINVGGTVYSSDERFKKNIKKLEGSLAKIVQISGYEYDWRDDEFKAKNFGKKHQIGLLAQNIEKIVPEAVQEISDGYKGIDYAKLVPLLIESIKELSAKIVILENKLKN